MNRYAAKTAVSPERSRNEIERLLARFGASQFGYLTDQAACKAHIIFVYRGLRIRISVGLPNGNDPERAKTATGRERSGNQIQLELDREVRRRWRSLTLLVKAKLVAVIDGVATFEEEFLPYILWGDGRTTAEQLSGKVLEIEKSGKTPKLLPMPDDEK